MGEFLTGLGIDLHLLGVQIVGFIVLFFFMRQFVFKPIFGMLDQRQADIKATYDQMDADRNSMEQTRRHYEQRLADIESEAREKIQAAIKEAQALRESIIADAHLQAEAVLEKSRTESQREREKAFLEMRQQIVALSIAAAGKVVSESLDAKKHSKLVDDFIGNVAIGRASNSSGNGTGQRGTAAE